MGDRAVVVFKSGHDFSPCVYVHWDGEHIPTLLMEAAPKMRKGDISYACARFIGHLNDSIPGPLSLGVYNLSGDYRTENPGDAGVFLVDVDSGKVENYGGYKPSIDLASITLQFAEV